MKGRPARPPAGTRACLDLRAVALNLPLAVTMMLESLCLCVSYVVINTEGENVFS